MQFVCVRGIILEIVLLFGMTSFVVLGEYFVVFVNLLLLSYCSSFHFVNKLTSFGSS